MKRSVALVGKMCSGKTTIATELTGRGYTRISHADALKEVAAMAYGPIDKSGLYHVDGPGWADVMSGREILQQLGQAVKGLDQEFWLKITLRKWRESLTSVVNDDTRFPFEAAALSSVGFLIVKVVVPEETRIARYTALYGRAPSAAESAHESERYIDDITADMMVAGDDDPAVVAKVIDAHARRLKRA